MSAPSTTKAIKLGSSPRRASSSRRARPVRLTDRDLELSGSWPPSVRPCRTPAGVASDERRRRLPPAVAGWSTPGCCPIDGSSTPSPGAIMVTNGGLAVIDSELPRPAIDLRSYRHDTRRGVVVASRKRRAVRPGRAGAERARDALPGSATGHTCRRRFGVPSRAMTAGPPSGPLPRRAAGDAGRGATCVASSSSAQEPPTARGHHDRLCGRPAHTASGLSGRSWIG